MGKADRIRSEREAAEAAAASRKAQDVDPAHVVLEETRIIHTFTWQMAEQGPQRHLIITTPQGTQYVLPFSLEAAQDLGKALAMHRVDTATPADLARLGLQNGSPG